MRYFADFKGREKTAIGATYKISYQVIAYDEEAARLKLYDRFDHISDLNLRPAHLSNRTKRCTCCGNETTRQPQNYDQDTGYGHCDSCLSEFWPKVASIEFENDSFDIRREQKGSYLMVDHYSIGELQARFNVHNKTIDQVLDSYRKLLNEDGEVTEYEN